MDPDATLAEIRQLIDREMFYDTDGDRLCELFGALDAWLSKGGFLPSSWAHHERVRHLTGVEAQEMTLEEYTRLTTIAPPNRVLPRDQRP